MKMFQLIFHTIHLNDNLEHCCKMYVFYKIEFDTSLTSYYFAGKFVKLHESFRTGICVEVFPNLYELYRLLVARLNLPHIYSLE